jgi:hypothetical protein
MLRWFCHYVFDSSRSRPYRHENGFGHTNKHRMPIPKWFRLIVRGKIRLVVFEPDKAGKWRIAFQRFTDCPRRPRYIHSADATGSFRHSGAKRVVRNCRKKDWQSRPPLVRR